jgi:hypothetical protein
MVRMRMYMGSLDRHVSEAVQALYLAAAFDQEIAANDQRAGDVEVALYDEVSGGLKILAFEAVDERGLR